MAQISHNTENMRKWSGDITEAQETFNSYYEKLYQIIERFGNEIFEGNLSKDFQDYVLDKKDKFKSLGETLGECAELVSKTSQKIDSDTESLKNDIKYKNDIL